MTETTLTVKELIEELSKLEQDMPIIFAPCGWYETELFKDEIVEHAIISYSTYNGYHYKFTV
ncbi:hypothetical protein IGI65_001616 [Enterococcus sp. DIV0755b]|uniref:hypothetical protein n=1 Tax=Enterococcus sp. DIV0755b TaxID=2774657 RepID=UPI003F237E71